MVGFAGKKQESKGIGLCHEPVHLSVMVTKE
jgi:hypothetical protein